MSTPIRKRPTTARIDLEKLAFNFGSIKAFVGSSCKYMAVVKADAYGHGAVECALRLAAEGIDWFGVALLEEAIELRAAGIDNPILCFGALWPGQAEIFIEQRITPVIFSLDHALMLSQASLAAGVRLKAHVKIDTGMGRVGVPFSAVAEFAEGLGLIPGIEIQGLMTHFAAADDLGQNNFTDAQISRMGDALRIFESNGLRPDLVDMANSPGAIAHPDSRGNMVRLGGILYGLGGDVLPAGVDRPDLRPVLSLTTKIAQVKTVPSGTSVGYGRSFITGRETRVGTIPIGYHDGYRRCLSNNSRVLVNGVFAPVVGRISMDWTAIDLTDVPEALVGSDVVLIGGEQGRMILAEDLASLADTISYEITCGISRRVPRLYT